MKYSSTSDYIDLFIHDGWQIKEEPEISGKTLWIQNASNKRGLTECFNENKVIHICYRYKCFNITQRKAGFVNVQKTFVLQKKRY